MNIYEKIQTIKVAIASSGIKPTGSNKHLNCKYYELGDFLPILNKLLLENKVSTHISFQLDKASLLAVNIEKPEERVLIESPMSTANLRNCHEVQNLGAVQTYIRRYLYTNMFDIVDRDVLDGTITEEPLNKEKQKPDPVDAIKPDKPADWDRKSRVAQLAWNDQFKTKYPVKEQ